MPDRPEDTPDGTAPAAEQPAVRVVRGAPTAEEIAALVGALLSRPRPASARKAGPEPSRWRDSARPRQGRRPGPDAWRAAALPR